MFATHVFVEIPVNLNDWTQMQSQRWTYMFSWYVFLFQMWQSKQQIGSCLESPQDNDHMVTSVTNCPQIHLAPCTEALLGEGRGQARMTRSFPTGLIHHLVHLLCENPNWNVTLLVSELLNAAKYCLVEHKLVFYNMCVPKCTKYVYRTPKLCGKPLQKSWGGSSILNLMD